MKRIFLLITIFLFAGLSSAQASGNGIAGNQNYLNSARIVRVHAHPKKHKVRKVKRHKAHRASA